MNCSIIYVVGEGNGCKIQEIFPNYYTPMFPLVMKSMLSYDTMFLKFTYSMLLTNKVKEKTIGNRKQGYPDSQEHSCLPYAGVQTLGHPKNIALYFIKDNDNIYK